MKKQMRIAVIPQLTRMQSGVSLSLDGIKPTLERFEKSYGLDLDPEFQRGHVWDLRTKTKFVEYILRGGIVQPIRFNSPVFGGETHAKNSDLPETVVLVDGKQRLTAIQEFIDDDLLVFGSDGFRGYGISDFDKPAQLLLTIDIQYSVNKLQTKKELYTWYLEMNEGQVAHSREELDRVRKMLESL